MRHDKWHTRCPVANSATHYSPRRLEQQRQSKTALIALLNTGAASGQAAAGQAGAQALPVTPRISATAVESIPNFESWVKRLPTILRQFCGKSSRGRKFDKCSAYSIKKIHEDSFGLAIDTRWKNRNYSGFAKSSLRKEKFVTYFIRGIRRWQFSPRLIQNPPLMIRECVSIYCELETNASFAPAWAPHHEETIRLLTLQLEKQDVELKELKEDQGKNWGNRPRHVSVNGITHPQETSYLQSASAVEKKDICWGIVLFQVGAVGLSKS